MEKQKKKFNSKKLWLLVILISIILVPSFYGFTYLKSYWNNSTTINQVPIAVVNLDQPYTKDGKTYNIGSSVISNLKTNKTLDWKFVNYDEGKNGLYGTKYYAMLVIPKNFSQEVANASTDGFKKPQIDFYQNQGKNFIFSEISGIGAAQIQQNISQSISKSVSNVLVQTIYQTKDGFKTAASGASQLESGINQLSNGSKGLATGMDKLQSGSSALNGGVSKLQNGATALTSGVDKLHNGSEGLVSGMDKLQSGSSALESGVNKLQDGSVALENGVQKLQGGSSALLSGMTKLQGGSEKLQAGVESLQNGSSNLANGMEKLQAGANTVAAGQQGITEELNELNALIAKGDTKDAKTLAGEISAQSAKLSSGMSSLNQGISNAANGASKLNNGIGSLGTGVASLSTGINSAKNGAAEINGGLGTVGNGVVALNGGLSSAKAGVTALNNGLGSAKTGAMALNSGLGSAQTGAIALNGGLGTVANGMNTLNSGIQSAGAGATKLDKGLQSAGAGVSKLTSGLNSGYNSLNDNVKFTAEQMSEFISNPVTLNTIAINPVSSYGEGFAPYFICIATWIGAMYTYFIASALSRKFKGSFKRRFAKMYLIGTAICVIQSLIMTTVIYYGLGMKSTTVGLFYLVNLLTVMAVYSFMNGLHYIMPNIMKGALVVIMVFQFTACGGSYPVIMMPSFYSAIHPFLILSYGVSSMRMAISGVNYTVLYHDIAMLIAFIVGSLIVGFLVGAIKVRITHKRVMREKSELVSEKETFNQFV